MTVSNGVSTDASNCKPNQTTYQCARLNKSLFSVNKISRRIEITPPRCWQQQCQPTTALATWKQLFFVFLSLRHSDYVDSSDLLDAGWRAAAADLRNWNSATTYPSTATLSSKTREYRCTDTSHAVLFRANDVVAPAPCSSRTIWNEKSRTSVTSFPLPAHPTRSPSAQHWFTRPAIWTHSIYQYAQA